ncbi:zinc ribbon domain-containing protein [Christensenellaceae bacterium OttesenSCG-928-M15]|nr:zinc ribbon domain-containing protein [Christensenellaceae bacterium OttesenSCG-928-M15]
MAYCVNCGVELEKSIQFCPLCGVEAVNPKEPYDPLLIKPYSSHITRLQASTARRYVALIVTVILLFVGVVCAMANLVYGGTLTWSIYVISSLMLGFVVILLPMLYPGLHPAAAILLDVCALLLFLYLINMADSKSDWYMTLAMPQVLIVGLLALMDVLAFKSRKIQGFEQYGVVSISVGVSMLGLEILLDLFNNMVVELSWSLFVVAPTVFLGIIFFILERKREVKDKILRRLRI